jgi:nucleoid DNA-binding protein
MVFFIFVLMTIAKYISDLLYRYECVIVPNFGGFVTNEISARVNHFTHTFYAPSKQITFNSHLQNNDGLLANYVATSENTSYAKAVEYIEKEVESWKLLMNNEELDLENIGSFNLNKEGKFIFEPSNSINYLTSSFGLSSYVSPAVKRITYKEKVKQLETIAPLLPSEENKRKTPAFIKYAAAAVIIFALGTVGWKEYQKFEYNNLVARAEQQQKNVEQSIQEATFVISNPLPVITLNVAKETNNYHIIAGAFREPGNAEKKLQQLLKKGYDAKILGINKWNLTPVAFESLNSRADAINRLNAIKRMESEDAWLLVKEY